MGRLIEADLSAAARLTVVINSGDVLLLRATGGRVRSGEDVIEMLGAFVPAVIGDNGQVLTPMSAPNAVLFRALRPGQATIDVSTGDPWYSPRTTVLGITVEP